MTAPPQNRCPLIRSVARPVFAAAAVLLSGGCASLRPGPPEAPPGGAAGDASAAVASAQALSRDADSEARLDEAIRAWESALEIDPGNNESLVEACQLHILKAAAYTESTREKRSGYRRGIRYCERAMYTNGDVRELVARGTPLQEAASAMTRREADAMLFWVTGVSYYFKECMGGLAKLTGYRLILKTETFLSRLAEIDPDYADGAVHFSLGIYYLGLPRFAGGDDERSRELLERAAEVGPESLLVRWGRAKYFYVETRDRDGFESDLRWVLARDPRTPSNPYPWNVYFQRDAARLLAAADRLF